MSSNNEFRPADLLHMDAEQAVNYVMLQATRVRASDLFLLSEEKAVQIAVRRMGRMERLAMVSTDQGRHMMSYIKTMAEMELTEHRRPLEGRWLAEIEGKRLDLRVDSVPTLYGSDFSLRIWDRDTGLLRLDQLGMSHADLSKLAAMLGRASGLLLVTGPSGSGRTTTLYACLQYLNNGERKINTLEDPIEFSLPGVRQSQVNLRSEATYASLLRHVLRQTPDVIMVGEIGDAATAAIAVQAANGGHLVLVSVPASIAASAVHSMLALNAPPYFLSTCLLGAVAQRLIRTLCPNCRVFYDVSESPQTFQEINDLLPNEVPRAIYGPGGCEQCLGTGYSGRIGLFEVMTMNQELRRLVAEARPRSELQAAAVRAGMVEFRRGALLKVAGGTTSTEDILREVSAELLGIED
jgi:type II secretory ATPase GspE/PulE/Tfp pilus assembly ATPase PilB-like protein